MNVVHRENQTINDMCPPSSTHGRSPSGPNPGLVFDVRRKSMCLNHKFTTADKSQVCDGRNWEKFRVRNDRNKSDDCSCSTTSKSSTSSDGSRVDRIKSRVLEKYKPVSSRSAPALGPEEDGRQREEHPLPPKQHRQDDKDPPRRTSLEDSMKTAERDSSSAPPTAKEEEMLTKKHDGPRDLWDGGNSRGSSGGRRRSSSSSTRRRSSKEDRGNDDKSYRRASSEGGGGRRSSRRRHSNEDKIPKDPRLRRRGKPSRRLSVDSNTSSTDPDMSGARVTVRKLSEPMHRCSVANSNVSGIMRPARYSSNNLAAMATKKPAPSVKPEDPPAVPKEEVAGTKPMRRRASIGEAEPASSSIRRNFSLLNLSSELGLNLARQDSSLASSKPPVRSSSAEDFHRFVSSNKTMRHDEELGNAQWVASGVAFSRSMEVYLFKT